MTNSSNNLAELTPDIPESNAVIPFWSADLTDGRKHADECVAYITAHEAPPLLGQVAKAQIALGVFGVVEIAFWQRIAELAMAGVS